jgi:hypothetical protein
LDNFCPTGDPVKSIAIGVVVVPVVGVVDVLPVSVNDEAVAVVLPVFFAAFASTFASFASAFATFAVVVAFADGPFADGAFADGPCVVFVGPCVVLVGPCVVVDVVFGPRFAELPR